ncbi:fido domain-containing protein [Cristinia sonorae]|uniref:Fido domain-containing protein n=1 Tax=Cristinia sonorae TaxID=1940300 RepID=A0A8K0UIG9_9AGAR|nr:fido domain-containing protein [Cristinia sonorae]
MLRESLRVQSRSAGPFAHTARTWEDLLEIYPDSQYLLRVVADMRWMSGAHISALELYKKVREKDTTTGYKTENAGLSARLNHSVLQSYKYNPTNMSKYGSQRWQSTITSDNPTELLAHDAFTPRDYQDIRNVWNSLSEIDQRKYVNYLCVETQALEGAALFDDATTKKLVNTGFTNVEIKNNNIRGGEITDCADAVSLLQDTFKTIEMVTSSAFLDEDPAPLDIKTICDLHLLLMKSSRVLPGTSSSGAQGSTVVVKYTHIGKTRQDLKFNVTAKQSGDQAVGHIQYCPYDVVDAELNVFCDRFNYLIRQNVDPFFVSAWSQHVFLTIHPFEDGNGRLSRILSSIPLLRNKLPPLSIPIRQKQNYMTSLDHVRL